MASRRNHGTGSLFRDKQGRWTVAVPPPPKDGKRQRALKRFKSRADAVEHLRGFERAVSGTDLPSSKEYPQALAGRPRASGLRTGYRSASTHSCGLGLPMDTGVLSSLTSFPRSVHTRFSGRFAPRTSGGYNRRSGRTSYRRPCATNVHTIAARAFDVACARKRSPGTPYASSSSLVRLLAD